MTARAREELISLSDSPRNTLDRDTNPSFISKQAETNIGMEQRRKVEQMPGGYDDSESGCGYFLSAIIWLISIILICCTFPFSLCVTVKQVQEYERAVLFRLGKVKKGGPVGPGLFFIIPCMDTIQVVDLRTVSFDVPPQEILTKDSVTVAVDAVVYYKINNPMSAVCNVTNASQSTRLLASTTLRNTLGTKTLQEILADREDIAHSILSSLDAATDPWGIRVEVKDVRLPQQLQRAMAAEAEATRQARAKVIE